MATFPSTLPSPTRSGYQIQPQDATARTDMETGPSRVRRRSSAPPDYITLAWRLTDAEWVTLRAWFENDSTGAAHGAAWFDIDLPTGTGTGGVATTQARFRGPPQASPLPGLNWDVTAQVEARHA